MRTTDVVAGMLHVVGDTVAARIGANTCAIEVTEHPDRAWIRSEIVRRIPQQQLADGGVTVRITPRDCATFYQATESADSVYRTIRMDVEVAFVGTNSTTALTVADQRRERILRTEVAAAEDVSHVWTHGDVPPPRSTFWDDVAEPAIFVAAAAVTVVLLFTVRSQ
jgi:hypothetical protein